MLSSTLEQWGREIPKCEWPSPLMTDSLNTCIRLMNLIAQNIGLDNYPFSGSYALICVLDRLFRIRILNRVLLLNSLFDINNIYTRYAPYYFKDILQILTKLDKIWRSYSENLNCVMLSEWDNEIGNTMAENVFRIT